MKTRVVKILVCLIKDVYFKIMFQGHGNIVIKVCIKLNFYHDMYSSFYSICIVFVTKFFMHTLNENFLDKIKLKVFWESYLLQGILQTRKSAQHNIFTI